MGKIKGWKKKSDNFWQHEETDALVQIVSTKTYGYTDETRNGKRRYDVYVESRNHPKHDRVKIPLIKEKSIAMKNAINWMKSHPRG